jgi:hypothetical protein
MTALGAARVKARARIIWSDNLLPAFNKTTSAGIMPETEGYTRKIPCGKRAMLSFYTTSVESGLSLPEVFGDRESS